MRKHISVVLAAVTLFSLSVCDQSEITYAEAKTKAESETKIEAEYQIETGNGPENESRADENLGSEAESIDIISSSYNWNDAYRRFVENEEFLNLGQDYGTDASYIVSLYDYDSDNIPELIISNGFDVRAFSCNYCYTFDGKDIVYCGSSPPIDYYYVDDDNYPGLIGKYYVFGDSEIKYSYYFKSGETILSELIYTEFNTFDSSEIQQSTINDGLFQVCCGDKTLLPGYEFDKILKMGWDSFVKLWPYKVEEDGSADGFEVQSTQASEHEKNQISDDPFRETKTRSVKFTSDIDLDLNWGYELFNKNSSEYDHDLAMAGLTLSQAAESGKSDICKRYEDLGFENIASNEKYDSVFNLYDPASAFASKRIDINGKSKYVIAVVIRGTDAGTFDLWTDFSSQLFPGIYNGFNRASETVQAHFSEYYEKVKKYYSEYEAPNKDNTILFITGHSMGGAVAGLISKGMDEKYAERENIFTYTFASPNYETTLFDRKGFTNIHNIINCSDIVPRLPIPGLFYVSSVVLGKNGHFWYYGWDDNNEVFKTGLKKNYPDKSDFSSLDVSLQHDCRTYLAYMITGLPFDTGSGAKNNYSVASIHCPVDIQVLDAEGKLMVQTDADKVVYEDTDISVLVLTDNDEKYVVADEAAEYTIRFIGTGSGTMNYTQAIVTFDGENVISEDSFENVIIKSGKLMETHVSPKNQESIQLHVIDEDGSITGIVAEDGTERPLDSSVDRFSEQYLDKPDFVEYFYELASGGGSSGFFASLFAKITEWISSSVQCVRDFVLQLEHRALNN